MENEARAIESGQVEKGSYRAVLEAMGFEVRDNARMFRRLSIASTGSIRFTGVPDFFSASDAALYLTPEKRGGRFIDISQSQVGWTAQWLRYGAGAESSVASSDSLGAAMWAAFVRSL